MTHESKDREQTPTPPGYSALGRAIGEGATSERVRARISKRRRATNAERLRRRESRLLAELQRDHGYMLAEMPRVRGIKMRRIIMTPALIVRLIVPTASSLGEHPATRDRTSDRSRRRKAGRGG